MRLEIDGTTGILELDNTQKRFTVNIRWICNPILEVTRVIAECNPDRVVTNNNRNSNSNSNSNNNNNNKQKPIEAYLLGSVRRYVRKMYPLSSIVDSNDADITLDIKANIAKQARICELFASLSGCSSQLSFNKKRKVIETTTSISNSIIDAPSLSFLPPYVNVLPSAADLNVISIGHDSCSRAEAVVAPADDDDISQNDADRVISAIKKSTPESLRLCINQFSEDLRTLLFRSSSTWTVRKSLKPIYLLGRYNKFARDVPQAPWTIGTDESMSSNSSSSSNSNSNSSKNSSSNNNSSNSSGSSGSDSGDMVFASQVGLDSDSGSELLRPRKGRYSIEEIIADAVKVNEGGGGG